MTVEAHHLHCFPSSLIPHREFMNTIDDQAAIYNSQIGSAAAGGLVPFYNSAAAAADATVSGLTTFNGPSASTPINSHQRKRPRGATENYHHSVGSSFLDDDMISSHLEIDSLLSHHMEKVKAELWERRRQFMQRVVAAMEEVVVRRLRAKEEEIERIGRLNTVLEERAQSLFVENQVWRDLADSNEAAAHALRAGLEQALANNGGSSGGSDGADSAESCCDSNHCDSNSKVAVDGRQRRRKVVCRGCEEREPNLLLLPCRHLCLCSSCGVQAKNCPICNCTKHGTVHVNFS